METANFCGNSYGNQESDRYLNTLHKTDAPHATGELFRRYPLGENDTKNGPSLEM